MNPELARKINLALVFLVAIVMGGSLAVQFIMGELPCPLCILQRYAIVGLAMGPLLNLRFGIRPRHLSVTLMFALFGIAVSTRQVLLHIVPGSGGYGTPIFGLHLYSWSSLIFYIALVVTFLECGWRCPDNPVNYMFLSS